MRVPMHAIPNENGRRVEWRVAWVGCGVATVCSRIGWDDQGLAPDTRKEPAEVGSAGSRRMTNEAL